MPGKCEVWGERHPKSEEFDLCLGGWEIWTGSAKYWKCQVQLLCIYKTQCLPTWFDKCNLSHSDIKDFKGLQRYSFCKWFHWKKMEMFWFFRLRFRCAYDSTYDSDLLFSQGHQQSYNFAYESNSGSVASENQPSLSHTLITKFMRLSNHPDFAWKSWIPTNMRSREENPDFEICSDIFKWILIILVQIHIQSLLSHANDNKHKNDNILI